MKLAFGAIAALLPLLSQNALADTHCYTFRNDSAAVVALNFSYQPAAGNVITGAALDPGKTYPFDGRPWCWNLPEDVTAVVTVAGTAAPQWKGTLLLGNRTGSAPSGTYVVGAPKAGGPPVEAPAVAAAAAAPSVPAAAAGPAVAAVAAAPAVGAAAAASATPAASATRAAAQPDPCLANPYPDSDNYCLTALETGVHLNCGIGHTGVSGTLTVSHLTVKCRNGKKLKLTCGTATGGRQKCNLNDQEICTDDYVRSAADYCGR
jgi:hypothetical protein